MAAPRPRQERRPSLRRKLFATATATTTTTTTTTAATTAAATTAAETTAAATTTAATTSATRAGTDGTAGTMASSASQARRTAATRASTPAPAASTRAGRLLAGLSARGRPRARRATVVGIEGSGVGGGVAALGPGAAPEAELGQQGGARALLGEAPDADAGERRPASRQRRASTMTTSTTTKMFSSSSSSSVSSSSFSVGAGRQRRMSTSSSTALLSSSPSSPRRSFDLVAAQEHDSHRSSRLGTSIAAEIEDYLNFKPVPSASPASRSRSRASSAHASSSEFACISSPPPLPSRDAVNFQDARVCQQRRGSMMAAKFRLGEQVIVLKQLDRKWVVREGMVVHVHIESPTQDRFYSVRFEDSGDRLQVDESNLVECPSESANVLFRTQTYLLDVRHAVKGAEALATRVESASRDPEAHASLATLERKMSQSLETLTRWTSFVPPVDDWDALSFAAAEAREMLVAEARKLIVNAEVKLYLARGRLSFNTDRNQEALADAKAALERAPDDKAAALLRSMALFNLSENTAALERTSSGVNSSDGSSSSSSSSASPTSEIVSAFSDADDASPDTTTTSTVGPSMEKSLGPDSECTLNVFQRRQVDGGNAEQQQQQQQQQQQKKKVARGLRQIETRPSSGSFAVSSNELLYETPRRTQRAASEQGQTLYSTMLPSSSSFFGSGKKKRDSGGSSSSRRRRASTSAFPRFVASPREEEEEVGEDAGNETAHCGVSYLDEDDALATTHKGAPKEVVNRPVLPAWQGGHAQGSHTLGESIVQEIDQYLCALDAEAVLERWQAANRSSPGGSTQYGASGDSDDDTGRFIL